jgi:flagella basal body P-ring formation protein FlgA
MDSLDNLVQGDLAAYDAAEFGFELLNLTRTTTRRERTLRMIFVIGGAVLLTVAAAQADSGLASDAPGTSALVSRIASQLAPLLPDGMRLKKVELQFAPPVGATLQNVAPGVTQLRSRSFLVQLQAHGRTMAVSAAIDAEREVIVAAHDVAPGAAVGEGDVETRWVEAFSAAPGAMRRLPTGAQYVAAGPLRPGDPLYPSSITRALAVRPGDMVALLVRNGPITVRTTLEARSAAAVGESATLVNPESDTLLTVNVTGPKTAELVMQ